MPFGPKHWHHWHKYMTMILKQNISIITHILSGMTHNKLNDPTTPGISACAFHIQRKCYKVQSRRPKY
jgi:hypothetical protein